MTNEPISLPRPAPALVLVEAEIEPGDVCPNCGFNSERTGAPDRIEGAAISLMDEIREGSVDADSFASNCILALGAMGIPIQPAFLPAVANMLGSGWESA